jgi:uncharacterized C2H2 Zn-finger protein
MTNSTDRVWQGVHDDAPRDDEGRPIHPEKGYPICGQPKTDATANNGRKRDDVPYCLQYAGHGTDRKTGACSKHGGAGGAPEGWRNGNARHLLFSKRMNDDDRDQFNAIVEGPDGERIGVDEMAEMLERMIGFEYMRLSRAVDKTPDVDMITVYECPRCGKGYRRGQDDGSVVDRCHGDVRIAPKEYEPCDYSGELKRVAGKSWVDFGDESVERKEARIANLIATYKKVAEGSDVNVRGDHDVSVSGGGDPVEVNITSVGVDLPDDVDGDDGGDGEE